MTPGELTDLWIDIGVPKKTGSEEKGRERTRDKILGFFVGAKGNQPSDVQDTRVHIQVCWHTSAKVMTCTARLWSGRVSPVESFKRALPLCSVVDDTVAVLNVEPTMTLPFTLANGPETCSATHPDLYKQDIHALAYALGKGLPF